MNITVSVTTSLEALPNLLKKLKEFQELDASTQSIPPIGVPLPVPGAASNAAPAILTEAQARDFVANCSGRTLIVLRTILDGRLLPFRLSVLASDLGEKSSDLTGVWGGLTKRARTVLGDRDARPIVWLDYRDNQGKWTDSDGMMDDTTVASLRKALGLTPN